ncbi:unnamed protein product [Caenorhabditis bovis]|uniref:Uncharacterized protein n=1 Tax=Caenorhabditis bovis TaxID=2654633 RepID=A0A8S1F508_9PELO|nr:unnamed protein product [Caenorhabditis bovis]
MLSKLLLSIIGIAMVGGFLEELQPISEQIDKISETVNALPERFAFNHKYRQHATTLCQQNNPCGEDTMFLYYKCCRNTTNACCWHLRIWVM